MILISRTNLLTQSPIVVRRNAYGDESVQNLPVEITKENNLSSYHYLRYLFEALSNNDLNNKEGIDKVLPWSMDLPSRCIVPKKVK
ncbi:hypothetical protein N7917_00570 [Bacillus sp. OR9]|nr:hypothetical protein [Bacillus sp. OR9]